MGSPLKDANGTNIINPINGNLLQTNDAKVEIITHIKNQLDKLEAVPSQWKFDKHSETEEHKVFLKHKFDEDINSLTESVYPFNIGGGKVYMLDNNEYVKASKGGTEYTDTWTDKQDGEFLKINNLEEEIILSDRFIVDDENNTIIDTTTYLMWEDTPIPTLRWTGADTYCQNLILDSYENWKLPNFSELQSIISPDSENHVYDEFTKLDEKPYGYWSSDTTTSYEMQWIWWRSGYYMVEVEKADVLSYYSGAISSWTINNYEMNVMCVNQL